MAKVVVKSKAKKVKRKFPVEIKAPEFLGGGTVGKSQVTDLNALVGTTTKMNLMYVSGNMKNQNIRLKLRVEEVASGLAQTRVSHYEQIPYYLTRTLKAGSDLVEDAHSYTSSDGHACVVKPFMVTKSKASSPVLSALRAKAREVLAAEIGSKSYDEFVSSVISGKIQNFFRNELKKVFPLKTFEIRKIELQ